MKPGSIEQLIDQMRRSAFIITLWSGNVDTKILCETGAAVLLDKPLLVVRIRGARLPDQLRRIATEVVDAESFEQAQAPIVAAIRRMTEKLKHEERARRARD